jgi:ABC-2 type transport system ATP-binding protein
MLSIAGASKSYGSGVKAVDGLNLEVRPREIFGFLGPNGAGKTTTIKMIVGALTPDEGTIVVNGRDIAKDPIEAKRQIGFVPDEAQIWEKLTARVLNFMGDVLQGSGEERERRIIPAFPRRLRWPAGQGPSGVLKGDAPKICLIGSMMHGPPLWILMSR